MPSEFILIWRFFFYIEIFLRDKLFSMEIKEFVNMRKQALKSEIASMDKKPTLMIIQANDDPASNAYVRGKLKDGDEIGADVILNKVDPLISQEELLKIIDKCNNDSSIDGLIVQLPLGKHINEDIIKLAVSSKKDIDGFHPLSSFVPCTPKGIVSYLENEGFTFSGKNAVVLGRSNIVGKPMAKLLLSRSCNVTVLHSKTSIEDKKFYIKHADLIVVAIGKEGFLNNDFEYNKDCYIVDVGINRGADGKLHGDAIPNLPVKLQTPVPGGVGLLTRLALLENLMEACR